MKIKDLEILLLTLDKEMEIEVFIAGRIYDIKETHIFKKENGELVFELGCGWIEKEF